jgi:RNA polymerase sigma factor (sigma-70 family)
MRNQVQELESSDDAALLAAVREGNDAAFGELYRRHVGAGRAAARALTRSAADADDAVAEAFARVLAVMRRGGGPEVAMRPYLMTVVRHVCFDRAGARDRETLPGETEVVAALDGLPTSYQSADLDQFTEANLVSRAFASLSDRWKHVLWQTDIEGRTPRELADELELAPTAVAALAFRAREGLADAYLAAHVTHRPTAQCNREPSELARYVRNRMRSKEQVTFRAHLDQCHRCTEAVEELRVVSRPLRSLQWPALIGAPVITYGGKVIGVIRRVVTAQLLTTAGAAAVTVATVGVATDRVPFEPFDALRPHPYVEAQSAAPAPDATAAAAGTAATGAATEAGTAAAAAVNAAVGSGSRGSHRSAIFPATTAAIPTISLVVGTTVVAPPTTVALSSPPTVDPAPPVGTTAPTAATPDTTVTSDGGAPPDTSAPATATTTDGSPAANPVGGTTESSTEEQPAPTTTTTVEVPTGTTPNGSGLSVTPIGGNPQTQSNGTDDDEPTPTTTTTTSTTTTTTVPDDPGAGGAS